MSSEKPNLVVVVSDTLRAGDLGCYGSAHVQTPNMDAFAATATRFTRAFPESLPTIPVRRALHTGRRAYPFRDYRPVPWDIVYLPGWQAMDNHEDTVAENLAAAGYHTGFVTDTLPYFAPGFNFQRGFYQWVYVRGQQQDRWQSPYAVPKERLARYNGEEAFAKDPHSLVPMHLANTAHVRSEEDTSTARVFKWATKFLEDNEAGQPFYLLIDCFDPHEPWDAPADYYSLYGDPDYAGRCIVHCGYAPADQLGYTAEEIAFVRAQYCGLVTLFDAWFGKFMARLTDLGYAKNTAVLLISDHGTNFCDNPRNVIGKPEYALYPGVMCLPLLARLPKQDTGSVSDALVYNIDVMATLYDLAGMGSEQGIDGQSLTPLISGTGDWTRREYVTCRYGHSLCYIDDEAWVLTNTDGEQREAFDLATDPACQHPLHDAQSTAALEKAWERLCEDAGGEFPDYRDRSRTDAIGQKPHKG